MKIIIKGNGKLKVNETLQKYITRKILKYEKIVKEPSVAEVVFKDLRGPKGGVDKCVNIRLTLPGVKNPIFVEVVTTDFTSSVDLAQERLEQRLKKYKDRKKIGTRWPLKYWLEKISERIR